MNRHSYLYFFCRQAKSLVPFFSHFIHFISNFIAVWFLFLFSKCYKDRVVALYLKEIALRINWKDFHPSFIQQMLDCSVNSHRTSAQSSLAQVFPGLGFVRKSNSAYNPFKAKTVSNIFQDRVENTCTFLAVVFATNLAIWKSMQIILYVSNSKEDFILCIFIFCFHTQLTVS